MYGWNSFQFVLFVNNFGGGVYKIRCVLSVIMMAEWSELRSRLLCISEIPLGTAKSTKSGILFRSAGQYYGSPVDKYFRLSCLIAVKKFRTLDVI
jgi:hypothetical protein